MDERLETTADMLKIDRSSWEVVKFGDVAIQQKENVDRDNSELTKYVKGEHMGSEDLHLRNWGELVDEYLGPAFIRKFNEGDILYGSRRTYLRKVVLAPFEGITSNTTFVIKANEKKIDSRLLPFIMMSERFTENSIKNSKGSVNPYINWKDISKYEFLLPPKDQQAQLAALLWAMDEVIEKEKEVLDNLGYSFLSNRKYFIEQGADLLQEPKEVRFGKICSRWNTNKLKNVCLLIGGNTFKSPLFLTNGQYQVLRIGNITEEGFDFNKSPVFINAIDKKEAKYLIPKDAIVISLTGTNGKRDYGFPSIMIEHNKCLLNQRLVMLIADETILLPEFLLLISKMELFQGKFFLNANGTANQANVSIVDVSEIDIPIPPIEEQRIIINKMNRIKRAIASSKQKISSSKALQKSLINQVF